MNTFKLALTAAGIASTMLYMKNRRAARHGSLGNETGTTPQRPAAPTNPSGESPNQGERLQAQHFQGAGNGVPFGMGNSNSSNGDQGHDDLLSPGTAKTSKTRGNQADAQTDADITPGLPDFSRGA